MHDVAAGLRLEAERHAAASCADDSGARTAETLRHAAEMSDLVRQGRDHAGAMGSAMMSDCGKDRSGGMCDHMGSMDQHH